MLCVQFSPKFQRSRQRLKMVFISLLRDSFIFGLLFARFQNKSFYNSLFLKTVGRLRVVSFVGRVVSPWLEVGVSTIVRIRASCNFAHPLVVRVPSRSPPTATLSWDGVHVHLWIKIRRNKDGRVSFRLRNILPVPVYRSLYPGWNWTAIAWVCRMIAWRLGLFNNCRPTLATTTRERKP